MKERRIRPRAARGLPSTRWGDCSRPRAERRGHPVLYDDDALIAEYNGSGAMAHRYVHGSEKDIDDPLIWYDNPIGG